MTRKFKKLSLEKVINTHGFNTSGGVPWASKAKGKLCRIGNLDQYHGEVELDSS